MYNRGQILLNIRAYNLCKLCGHLDAIPINPAMDKEIKAIIDKRANF